MLALRYADSDPEFYKQGKFGKPLRNTAAENISDPLHRMRQGGAVSR